tara:strand:+ start:858 stop:1070 length:213 start_codon:yes stop_codon:yes gene_type:complete
MTTIIVDDGKIEVYCKDFDQAVAYLEVLRKRGHTNFIIKEETHENKSARQIRKNIQEPIESYEDSPSVGL